MRGCLIEGLRAVSFRFEGEFLFCAADAYESVTVRALFFPSAFVALYALHRATRVVPRAVNGLKHG